MAQALFPAGSGRAIRGLLRLGKAARDFFRRDESGVVAVEFAIVSLPFFAMVLATIAIGLWYFYAACLDYAVYRSARAFLTGTEQASATPITTPALFSSLVLCPNMPAFMQCSASNPVVSMAVVSDFTSLVTTRTVGSGANQKKTTVLNPLPSNMCVPKQGDIVYLQAIYSMPTFPLIYTTIGGQLISGTSIRVEEFPAGTGVATTC